MQYSKWDGWEMQNVLQKLGLARGDQNWLLGGGDIKEWVEYSQVMVEMACSVFWEEWVADAKRDVENTMASRTAGAAAGERQGVAGKEASSWVPREGA